MDNLRVTLEAAGFKRPARFHIWSGEQLVAVSNGEFSPSDLQALGRLFAAAPNLLAACRPVLAEAEQREDYMHDTWNPEAHVGLTLTIAEIRAIHNAVAAASLPGGPQ